MMSKHLIPAMLAAADVVAAIVCACHKDWARTMYWLSAASITASTIFIK
jgi:hypothetical protein